MSERRVNEAETFAAADAAAAAAAGEEIAADGEQAVEQSSLEGPAAAPWPVDVRDIPLEEIATVANIRSFAADDEPFQGLMQSLHAQGQLQPALVRPAHNAAHGKPYELVFGHRRFAALERLGAATIRCMVHDVARADVLSVMLTENLQREDHSPLEEARVFKALIDLGGLSQAEIARRIGRDRSHISHRLRLLDLDGPIQQRIDAGQISGSAAEVIAALPDAADQQKLTDLIVRNDWGVRKAQRWARDRREHSQPAGELEAAKELEDPTAQPLPMVTPADAIELPRLELRDDLSAGDVDRIACWALLRNGMDQELLLWLEAEVQVGWDELWDYVRSFDDDEVRELLRKLTIRYASAAHRYPSLEETLKRDLGARAGTRPAADTVPAEQEATAPRADWEAAEIEPDDSDDEEHW